MSEIIKSGRDFVGYEYLAVSLEGGKLSLYLDAYQNFGWQVDGQPSRQDRRSRVAVALKRDRRITNRMELTRLQHHFDACAEEIRALERSRSSAATALALTVGSAGTALMAGSVFAVTAEPPNLPLCILLAVPAFAGWIAPILIYRWQVRRRSGQVAPLIEEKYEEIYRLCERGHELLPQ